MKGWSFNKNNLQKKVEKCKEKCNLLQTALDEQHDENTSKLYYAAKVEYQNKLHMLATSLKKNSKCDLLTMPDDNTKYFYAMLSKKAYINSFNDPIQANVETATNVEEQV